jgi:trehalose utilization protein
MNQQAALRVLVRDEQQEAQKKAYPDFLGKHLAEHLRKQPGLEVRSVSDKGEKFRAGCCWTVGEGRVFYFRPGHETYPVFHQDETLRIVHNAALWVGKRT